MAEARLRASLGLDSSDFSRGIDGAVSKTKSFETHLKSISRILKATLAMDVVNKLAGAITRLRDYTEKTGIQLVPDKELSKLEKTIEVIKGIGLALAAAAVKPLTFIIPGEAKEKPTEEQSKTIDALRKQIESMRQAAMSASEVLATKRGTLAAAEAMARTAQTQVEREEAALRLDIARREVGLAMVDLRKSEADESARVKEIALLLAQAAERERDALRESSVLRADIKEAGAQTPEDESKARIGALYERMTQARSAIGDPTDSGASIAEREKELLRRELEYERAKKALDDEIVRQTTDTINKELAGFFGDVDDAVAAKISRVAGVDMRRNQYESIGGQIGGASRADSGNVQREQLRELQAIREALENSNGPGEI